MPGQPSSETNLLPPSGGTYLLLFDLPESVTFQAGRLGSVTLAAGWYVYAGSALGPGGLQARVGRHLRSAKKQHWHVDYLTAVAPVRAVWYTVSEKRLECAWAAALRAVELEADALLKGTKVDGIYSDDPVKNPKATRFPSLSYGECLERGLRVMDMTAFALCMENGLPIVVFDATASGNIKRVVMGEDIGTVVEG